MKIKHKTQNQQTAEHPIQNQQLAFDMKKHESVRKIDSSRPIRYSSKEISERIKESAQMEYLFKRAETLYARPLKNSEQQMLISIVDYDGLHRDVAIMLVEYCFLVGKSTPAYIKKLAAAWVSCEINSIQLAEDRISHLKVYTGGYVQLARVCTV